MISQRHGFSLIELSIVLVIIALLVGGVITGQSLIHAAGLHTVSNDINKNTVALNSFRDKYMALPGDMPNATAFWGTDAGGCGAWHAVTGPTTATCNGNYDRMIATSAFSLDERFLAWQHLANAEMIEGKFTGKSADSGNNTPARGRNVPQNKVRDSYWVIFWGGPIDSADANFYEGDYRNMSWLLRGTGGGALSPQDMLSIDIKSDDGKPALGKIRTLKKTSVYSPNCTTDDTTSASYVGSNSTTMCILQVDYGV